MERTIILASHGRFASGILDSLELIFGKTHSILALDCYGTETFDIERLFQLEPAAADITQPAPHFNLVGFSAKQSRFVGLLVIDINNTAHNNRFRAFTA